MLYLDNNYIQDYIIDADIKFEGVYYYRIPKSIKTLALNSEYKIGDTVYVCDHKRGTGYFISDDKNDFDIELIDKDSIRQLVVMNLNGTTQLCMIL
jgi:hypothetical protein